MPVDDRSAFFGPFRNPRASGTALVIGTRHDPFAPYVWAKRLTADLGNARLLTYEGDGHGAITSLNPCIVGHMLAYLEAGALPPEGTVCTSGPRSKGRRRPRRSRDTCRRARPPRRSGRPGARPST
jgi:hypothetical protein